MLLNCLITFFAVTLILVPWEVGQDSCENLNLTVLYPPQSVLDGCNRPSNNSACDDACVARSDGCWLDYRSSVMSTIANHSSEPFLLIQVFIDMFCS